MKVNLETISHTFPISEQEYFDLDKKFGQLCYYASWQLKKKNVQNYFSRDPLGEDDVQELRIALMRAGSYYKRQCYIELCFKVLEHSITDKFLKELVIELEQLWEDRRRHGANRQKFGLYQEAILDRLVKKCIPLRTRPRKDEPLKIDTKFTTYCKQIIWNAQKALGKKITREKSWRHNMVSLSEYDYLAKTN